LTRSIPGVTRIWLVIGHVDVLWKFSTKIAHTGIKIVVPVFNLDSNKIGVQNLSTPFNTNPVISLVEIPGE
jgi:hypothetical protein